MTYTPKDVRDAQRGRMPVGFAKVPKADKKELGGVGKPGERGQQGLPGTPGTPGAEGPAGSLGSVSASAAGALNSYFGESNRSVDTELTGPSGTLVTIFVAGATTGNALIDVTILATSPDQSVQGWFTYRLHVEFTAGTPSITTLDSDSSASGSLSVSVGPSDPYVAVELSGPSSPEVGWTVIADTQLLFVS